MSLRRSALWLALAVSVLFNVFFLAGYLQARTGAALGPDGASPVQQVAEELELNEAQTRLYRQLRQGMQEEGAILEQGIALARQELLEELGRPEPDVERLREIVDREVDLHRQRRRAGAERFSEFVGMLSPDQCRRMAHHFGRGGRRDRDKSLLRRFDVDKDGHLDEQERAAAQAHIEERRRERDRRHAQMLERFDANGDGELDDAEREEARRWFMQNGGGRRRPRR